MKVPLPLQSRRQLAEQAIQLGEKYGSGNPEDSDYAIAAAIAGPEFAEDAILLGERHGDSRAEDGKCLFLVVRHQNCNIKMTSSKF